MKENEIELFEQISSSLNPTIVSLVMMTDVKEKMMLKELENVIEGAIYYPDSKTPKTIFTYRECTFVVYQNGKIVVQSPLQIDSTRRFFIEVLQKKLGERSHNTGYVYKTTPKIDTHKIVAEMTVPFHMDLTRLKMLFSDKCIYEPSIDDAALYHVEKDQKKIADVFLYAGGKVIISARRKTSIDSAKNMLIPILKKAKEGGQASKPVSTFDENSLFS